MALIRCKECGNEMSDKAVACPHCGCPNQKQIEVRQVLCEECGKDYPIEKESCPHCGCPNGIQFRNSHIDNLTHIADDMARWQAICPPLYMIEPEDIKNKDVCRVRLPLSKWGLINSKGELLIDDCDRINYYDPERIAHNISEGKYIGLVRGNLSCYMSRSGEILMDWSDLGHHTTGKYGVFVKYDLKRKIFYLADRSGAISPVYNGYKWTVYGSYLLFRYDKERKYIMYNHDLTNPHIIQGDAYWALFSCECSGFVSFECKKDGKPYISASYRPKMTWLFDLRLEKHFAYFPETRSFKSGDSDKGPFEKPFDIGMILKWAKKDGIKG